MHNLEAERLERVVGAIFERAESTPEEARTIARHLVAANLVGHDSHGVIRVGRYVAYWREGKCGRTSGRRSPIRPTASPWSKAIAAMAR
jgi:LDH2 family malate/lactate/ureidoglycolate dehydrogenase